MTETNPADYVTWMCDRLNKVTETRLGLSSGNNLYKLLKLEEITIQKELEKFLEETHGKQPKENGDKTAN